MLTPAHSFHPLHASLCTQQFAFSDCGHHKCSLMPLDSNKGQNLGNEVEDSDQKCSPRSRVETRSYPLRDTGFGTERWKLGLGTEIVDLDTKSGSFIPHYSCQEYASIQTTSGSSAGFLDQSETFLSHQSDGCLLDNAEASEYKELRTPNEISEAPEPSNLISNQRNLEGGACSEDEFIDQSFRDSFYNSGTDWSCLYEIDEYGMPCGEHFTFEQSKIKTNSPWNKLSGEKPVAMQPNKRPSTKLVQVDLAAFWGHKPKGISTDNSSKEAQHDNGSTSEKFAVSTCAFLAKFKHSRHLSTSAAPSRKRNGLPDCREYQPKVRRERRGTEMPASWFSKSCPFYKKIAGTPFTVDAFRYGAVEGCLAYFLTHFHSDHYGGLTKSWSHGPIYCTVVTARLLAVCLYVDSRWIFPVQLGNTQIIEGVEVTFLEANHCPGAAIILFRPKNGISILHTGDFRASVDMQSYPQLLECRISTLYLDTTYCNPRYRFPSQKDVIDFVIDTTRDALKTNPKTLVVVGAYSIGKERVYLSIAEALQVHIFTERHRSRLLLSMDWPELAGRLCSDARSTRLHVLPIGYLRPLKLKAYLQGFSNFTSVLAFRPTGWTFSENLGSHLHLIKPMTSGAVTIYGVPYSEHSSFIELREFVQFLRPEKIIPTVNNGRPEERNRMQSLFRQWLINN